MKKNKNNFAFDIGTDKLRIYKDGHQLIEVSTEINYEGRIVDDLIVNGKIADFNATQILLRQELRKLQKPILGFLYPSFSSLISVPSERNEVSMRGFRDAMQHLGSRKNFMIYDSYVAAVGLEIFSDDFSAMIVDFGAGKTSVTTIYRGEILKNEIFDISGLYLDKTIQTYLRSNYDLIIGLKEAEKLKIEYVDIRKNASFDRLITIEGVDKITNTAKTVSIQSGEISNYIKNEIEWLVERIVRHYNNLEHSVLKEIEPRGVHLLGGALKLNGLIDLIAERINVAPKSYSLSVDYMKIGIEKIQLNIQRFHNYLMM